MPEQFNRDVVGSSDLLRLALVFTLLWLFTVATLLVLGAVERERSEHLVSQHLPTMTAATRLQTAVEALSASLGAGTAGGDMAREVEAHRFEVQRELVLLDALLDTVPHAEDIALQRALQRVHGSLARLDAEEGRDGGADLVLRAEQLRRLAVQSYNGKVVTALDTRSSDRWLFMVALVVQFLLALALLLLIFRRMRRVGLRLAENALQLRQAIRIASLGYGRWRISDKSCVEASAELAGAFGMTPEAFVRHCAAPGAFLELVHPDDRESVQHLVSEVDGGHTPTVLYRTRSLDGVERHLLESAEADGAGGVMVVTQDVTDLKEAEARAVQSQRLDIVGQLTGGVAHDFNNLLAVISGSLEMMAAENLAPEQRELHRLASEAAGRGATLTAQLLAFARRQPLRPECLDIHLLVRDLVPLFRRTLTETVEIEVPPGDGCWPCLVDRTQLENALFNLVLNARDAMPSGGTLVVEMANMTVTRPQQTAQGELPAGDWVTISVSDSGQGMSYEVLERVFEPFFSTKDAAKGTGLGLAMVFGFVKQTGGHVTVHSQPGKGSTFRLYLPRAEGVATAQPTAAALRPLPQAGGVRVLVVEDEPDVLTLVTRQLQRIGCQTLATDDVTGALEVLGKEPVDVLLTDVVLRGTVNGQALAAQALARHPGLRVVYMSGYTRDALVKDGRLEGGVLLLQKPFSTAQLEDMLARTLDGVERTGRRAAAG